MEHESTPTEPLAGLSGIEQPTGEDLKEAWRVLSMQERLEALDVLTREEADDFFLDLPSNEQAHLLHALSRLRQRSFLRLLPPDDLADMLQCLPREEQHHLMGLLEPRSRAEVASLLRYEEDAAGGLMNPRYVRLQPDMTAEEALWYLRRQARDKAETIYVAYVLDDGHHLLGAVSLRRVLQAEPITRIRDLMESDPISVQEDAPQELVSKVFADEDLNVIPVVDANNCMKGIVTVDDIVDVVQEEATEDIQRLAGVASLQLPYLEVGMLQMLRKRAGWLTVLFCSGMLTTSAMSYYEASLQKATVLASFLALINSSGGNSGSQSTGLIVRALALGELKLKDWWLVLRRELVSGASLGCLLGLLGMVRIVIWEKSFATYGEHYVLLGAVIALTVFFVVVWGTISGAMLPFVIYRMGHDPAVASAPFVATFVDVTAIVIYFQLSEWILQGTLL